MKSFKQRLEALERLEALGAEDRLPDVATMRDDDVLAEVCYALHDGTMYCWHDLLTGRFWICELGGLNDVELEFWYRAMKPRVQPLIDAHADAIEALIPPNNGDGRVTSSAVLAVLEGVYA
jgi:hypothetical protein